MAVVAGRREAGDANTVATAAYPVALPEKIDPAADAWMAKLKAMVEKARHGAKPQES